MKKIGIVGSVFDKIFGVKIPYTSFFEQYGEVVILGPTIEVQEYGAIKNIVNFIK
jgi:hypothetical protein